MHLLFITVQIIQAASLPTCMQTLVSKQQSVMKHNYKLARGYQYETEADLRQTQCVERFCCHNKANITVGLLLSLGATTAPNWM